MLKEIASSPVETAAYVARQVRSGGIISAVGPAAGMVAGLLQKGAPDPSVYAVAPAALMVLVILAHRAGVRAARLRGEEVSRETSWAILKNKIPGYLELYVGAACAMLGLPGHGGPALFYAVLGWLFANELRSLFESEKALRGFAPDPEVLDLLGREAAMASQAQAPAPAPLDPGQLPLPVPPAEEADLPPPGPPQGD